MKCCITLMLLGMAATAHPAAGTHPLDYRFRELEPGIWLAYRPEVTRTPVMGNVTLIENEQDWVVVDSGGFPYVGEQLVRWIRARGDKPVSVLVNTHWHGDHNLGNAAFRAAWPELRIVGHAKTREAMSGAPIGYVKTMAEDFAAADRTIRDRIATLTKPEDADLRTRNERLLRDLERLRPLVADIPILPPEETLEERLLVQRPGRRIEIRHVGLANTDGDVAVWLPDDGVLVTGDMVVAPIPYGFGSFPVQWVATLDELMALKPKLIVPGHGEPMDDYAYLERLQALLRKVSADARTAVAAGQDLEAFQAGFSFGRLQAEMTGGDRVLDYLFDVWWRQPISRSAWLQASGRPIVQGPAE